MNWIVIVLGVTLLLAGVFLTFYTVIETESLFGVILITDMESPYQSYGLILLFFGILSLFMGLIWPGESASYNASRASQQKGEALSKKTN
jgi:hypothetical protein